MASEEKCEEIDSWSGIMNASKYSWISVTPSQLFNPSMYRIGIIKSNFIHGRQGTEPIVLITPYDVPGIYGQAHKVQSDNTMIEVSHFDSEKLLEYLIKYENNNNNNELRNGFKTVLHKEFLPGGMGIESLKPILTQQQWLRKDKRAILELKTIVQNHLLKRKNNQLKQLQDMQAEQQIMDLERKLSDDMEHNKIAFVRRLFHGTMRYGNRKSVINKSGNIYMTLCPDLFKLHFKPMILEFGGKQIGYKANHESWKAENLSKSNLECIFNEGRSLTKVDNKGFEFEPTNGTITYHIYTCKLVCYYTCQCVNEGTKEGTGNRRKHAKK